MTTSLQIWQGWPLTKIPEVEGGGASARAYQRKKARLNNQLETLKIIDASYPALVTGEPSIELTFKQVLKVLEKIHQNCDGKKLLLRHNFFCRGLANGRKKLAWNIPVPSPMVSLPREKSIATPESFAALKSLNILHSAFKQTLQDPTFYASDSDYIHKISANKNNTETNAKHLQLGRIIFSAVTEGALLNKQWLEAMLTALFNGDIVIEGNIIWLEISLAIGNKETAATIHRRWFPDPLTSLLILKWRNNYCHKKNKDAPQQNYPGLVSFSLDRFLACIGIAKRDRPTLLQFIDAAVTKTSLRLPQYLVQYAKKIDQAVSLPPVAWARLFYGMIPREALSSENTQDNSGKPLSSIKSDTPLPSTPDPPIPDQLNKLKELFRCFSDYHYKTRASSGLVCRSINKFLDDNKSMSQILQALAGWSLAMMQNKKITGKKSKPTAMHTYLYAIGKPLTIACMSHKIDSYSSEDWENTYDEILEQAKTPQNRETRRQRITEFHRYLMLYHNVPQVNIPDVAGQIRIVDANIITPKEYTIIRKYLQNDHRHPERLRKIQVLLFTLGFRCGLRRKEALTIQMNELQDDQGIWGDKKQRTPRPELLIRNNRFGTVKSSKSTRRLPLHESLGMLTEYEMNELFHFKKQRLEETKGVSNQELLFCLPGKGTDRLSAKDTFDVIQAAMRTITRDNTIVFHKLRYSFVNFMLIRTEEDDFDWLLCNLWWGDTQQFFPLPEKSLRKSHLLLGDSASCKEIPSSRRLLYNVSLLCGHIDPKETLATYLHVLDWILGRALRNRLIPLTTEQQAGILGIGSDSLKVYRSRKKLKGESTALDLLRVELKAHQKRYKNPILKEMIPLEEHVEIGELFGINEQPIAFKLYQIFQAHSEKQKAEDTARTFGVSTEEVSLWINHAKSLTSIKTKAGKNQRLVRARDHNATSNNPIFCPPLPHAQIDREDAANICQGVINLAERDLNLAQRGLQLYIKHSTMTQTDIKFKNEEDLVLYSSFLKEIVSDKDRVMSTLHLNPKSTQKQQLNYWSSSLQIPKKNFMKKTQNRPTRHANGRAEVWVKSPDGTHDLRKQEKPRSWPALGLHFGLFMAAVYLEVKEQGVGNQSD